MHPARTQLFVMVIGAIVGVTTVARGIDTYRNDEFGIKLPIPSGAHLLVRDSHEHDHGPVVLLDTAEAEKVEDLESHRYVAIFAGYNAADSTKRLGAFLESLCETVGRGGRRPVPEKIGLPGFQTEAAEVVHDSGWVDVIVATQTGTPDPAFDATVPSLNVAIRLHTRAEALSHDLDTFRAILRSVQLRNP